jgi:uncharacterized protein
MASINPSSALHTADIPGARAWSMVVRRGFALRLTDLEGGANCSALFFNAEEKTERYNMADTLKAQHTGFLTAGHVCYSDMGRILVAVTRDTRGWHDPICGVSDAAMLCTRYGVARYQEARNDFHRSGRDLFLVELGKWGLDKRDLVACVNFFSKVTVDASGQLSFMPSREGAGDQVELRAEMDTLVVLNTAPHPLDPSPLWSPHPVRCEIVAVPPAAIDDPCRVSCAENTRGYENTAIYHCQSDYREHA